MVNIDKVEQKHFNTMKNSNIKAVIVDLDGTLLNNRKKITPYTEQTIREIKDSVRIIPASARQFVRIEPYEKQLGIDNKDNYTICLNGAVVMRNDGEILFSQEIADETLLLLDSYMHTSGIEEWIVYTFDRKLDGLNITLPEQFYRENRVYKIVGISSEEKIQSARQSLPDDIRKGTEITSSEAGRIEFSARGIRKTGSLEMLLNTLNIKAEEIAAIGDGENDLDMICYAGIGIAMANAPETVKKEADLVTEYTNDEDGVGYILKELLL